MATFNKTQLIRDNKIGDEKAKSLKEPFGLLALFHDKRKGTATLRLQVDKSSILEIHKDLCEEGIDRNKALGMIDYECKKKIPLEQNRDLAIALINYLPHTQSWKSYELTGNGGWILNFDVSRAGITTRQCLQMDYEGWCETSTELQLSTEQQIGWRESTLNTTKLVLSPEQLKEREKFDKENKGLKQFFYGEEYVWALNRKNADKKANKIGLAV